MGGLFDALNIARSGINAAKAGVQLTGHNISNADTEGYHRRRLATSQVDPPPTAVPMLGGGVAVEGAFRTVDPLLARRLSSGLGQEAQARTRESLLLQVEQAVSELGDGGIGAAIANLMNSFDSLATSPGDLTVREEVLAAAGQLCDTFHRVAGQLDAVVQGAHDDVAAAAATVNEAAAQVARLNVQIVQAEVSGQEAGDLRDRRDTLVAQLSELAGVSSFEAEDGTTTVLLASHTLVQGDFAAALEVSQGADGRSAVAYTARGASVDITAPLSAGEMGGNLSVQATILDDVMVGLDQLAHDLGAAINTRHGAGFDLDGNPGGDLLSIPGTAPGAAAAIEVAAGVTARSLAASSSATSVPGNNENALALARLAEQGAATGGVTFAEATANLVGEVGLITEDAMRSAVMRKDELTHLQTLQQSSDGVSLDEEMVQLVQFQRSYQASVRVLQTIDQMLERIVEL